VPYWEEAIVPDLRAGLVVLVAAHGNSLRARRQAPGRDVRLGRVGLNIPTGIPLLYEVTESAGDLRPVEPGGTYLDPEAAPRPSPPSRRRAGRGVRWILVDAAAIQAAPGKAAEDAAIGS